MSFTCSHCGFSNNEMDYAGNIEPMGKKISFHVHSAEVSMKSARFCLSSHFLISFHTATSYLSYILSASANE